MTPEETPVLGCPNCCGQNVNRIREVEVSSNKVAAWLCHCSDCDFLFLKDPEWLEAFYKTEFYGDTGYVKRNIDNAAFLELLLLIRDFSDGSLQSFQACDFGTGLGMMPRVMRDLGYNFWGEDEYSKMPLIQPFTNPTSQSQLATAFEVVEHIPSFTDFLRPKINSAELVVFSTLLRGVGQVPQDDWWYYAFPNGQHISFHSTKSIIRAIQLCGLPKDSFLTDGSSLHAICLSSKWLKAWRLARRLHGSRTGRIVRSLLRMRYGRKSLTWADHLAAMKMLN